MKVAVDIVNGVIVDQLPDSATNDYKFLVVNGYKLLELDEPYREDGTFVDVPEDFLLVQEVIVSNDQFTSSVNALTANVPEAETSTWLKQEAEARSWLEDNTSFTPFIDGMLETRTKYTKAELVQKIIEKANTYAAAVGRLTGARQATEDGLE